MKEKKWYFGSYRGYFLLLILTGILMVAWGTTISTAFPSQLLIALGAAIVGASLSLLFGSISDYQIPKILAESLDPDFTSDESTIQPYRQKYHLYRVTEINEKPVWKHSVFDFSHYAGNGKLIAQETTFSPEGEACLYRVQAGMRDERLIIFIKALTGKEPTAVCIFPSFGKDYKKRNCGLHIHENWDGKEQINPCILTLVPIREWIEDKNIPIEIEKELMQIWNKGITDFSNLNMKL